MKKRIRMFIITGALIGSMAFGGAAMAYSGGNNGSNYSNWNQSSKKYTYNYNHNNNGYWYNCGWGWGNGNGNGWGWGCW
ncbi:hypothetical protein [Desulfotruncus alcoholivorax]|uniref:hypothetical protein n=1 Tax=Desulfotruncus alcoholivorax TaxID=265477 RepID=UPI00041CE6AC|nr:hypothetical protein [Desulfotruncus alcoholivorax]